MNHNAAMLQLPNGSFIYPSRYQSIEAVRRGTPPDLMVNLIGMTSGGVFEVEHIHCETYEQSDELGRVFSEAMGKYFPEIKVRFSQST